MKKVLLFSFLLVPFFVWQCSNSNDNPVATATKGVTTESIEIAIAAPNGFDTLVDRAYVIVSGPGMDSIKTELFIDSVSIYGKITNVPIGHSRLFEVMVYDYEGVLAYRGSSVSDIARGLNYIDITLHKMNDGIAIINGKIINTEIPVDTLDSGKDTTIYIPGDSLTSVDTVYNYIVIARTDTIQVKLVPGDTFNINLHTTRDTFEIMTKGTWCIAGNICCSAEGASGIDSSNVYESEYNGGALLARCGSNVYMVGKKATIIDPWGGKQLTLFANRLYENDYESGALNITIYQSYRELQLQ